MDNVFGGNGINFSHKTGDVQFNSIRSSIYNKIYVSIVDIIFELVKDRELYSKILRKK